MGGAILANQQNVNWETDEAIMRFVTQKSNIYEKDYEWTGITHPVDSSRSMFVPFTTILPLVLNDQTWHVFLNLNSKEMIAIIKEYICKKKHCTNNTKEY